MTWSNPVMCYIHIIIRFCHVQFCTLNVHISICFCMGFCHAHFCTNDYPYYSCMGFRHAHFCTNDYPYSYGFSSCTSLYEWLSILFLYGFSSCTSLYEWLSIFLWIFVMHIFVWMTIHIIMGFHHAHLFPNDYPYSYGVFFFIYCQFVWDVCRGLHT